MSDSTTWLDTLSASDSAKEVTANELFDAASPSSLFGRHGSTTTGLTWGYYGGRLWNGTVATLIANGTKTLANNATNYVEATTLGVVSTNTSGFTAGRIQIAKVTTVSGAVTAYEDHRAYAFGTGASIGGSGTVTSVNLTQPAAGITVSGGPITTTGSITLALANDLAAVEGLSGTGIARRTGTDTWTVGTAVALAEIATIADLRVLSNISGGSAIPAANTLSAILDAILSSAQGAVLYRGSSAWAALGPGTSGQLFESLGAAANPAWQTQPYDVGGFHPGVPLASAVCVRYPFPRAVVFPAGLTNSAGSAGTAATAQTDFDIKKNGSSVGTMRFAAAGTVPTFIMASQTSFAATDLLTVVAPASPDATLADIGFALAGTR